MSASSGQEADGIVDRVDEFFDGVYARLEEWRPRLQELLDDRLRDGALTGAQLVGLVESGAHHVLDGSDLYGAGFCATTDIVAEGNPLAWWQGAERSLLASSTFGPGQAAIDLQRLEWFRVPAETGERHVAGPFVDYLCSNEITVTVALPVFRDAAGERVFAGVACADALVATLEQRILPALEQVRGAVLINANGRVVLSTDPDLATGDRHPGVGADGDLSELRADARLVRSERHPFAVLVPGA